MTLNKQELAELRKWIGNAKEAATLKNAAFDDMFPKAIIIEPTKVTAFIQDRTRLYRDSWIIGPCEIALEVLDKAEQRNQQNRDHAKQRRA